MLRRAILFLTFLPCGVVLTLVTCWGPLFFYPSHSPLFSSSRVVGAWPSSDGLISILTLDGRSWWFVVKSETYGFYFGTLGTPRADGFTPVLGSDGGEIFSGQPVPTHAVNEGPPQWTRPPPALTGMRHVSAVRCRAGFPLPCLQWTWWYSSDNQ